MEINDTTRCYPRTLEEAFPWEPKNAEWIEKFDVQPLDYSEYVIIACATIVLLCTMILVWRL